MNGDYLSRAWRITLDNKYLWLLGIIAGVQLGGNDVDSGVDMFNFGAWLFFNDASYIWPTTFAAALAMIVSVVAWFLGLWARASLIDSVSQIDSYSTPGFMNSARDTVQNLLPLALMQIIVWSPMILMGVGILSNIFDGAGVVTNASDPSMIGLVCGFMFLLAVLLFVDTFAFRSIVVGNLRNPIQGIVHGTKTFLNSLGSIIITVIVYVIVAIILSFVVGIPIAAISAVLLSLVESMGANVQAVALVGYGLIMGIISAIIFAISTAFISAVFTLIHKDHADMSQLSPAQASNDGPPEIGQGTAHELHKKYNF